MAPVARPRRQSLVRHDKSPKEAAAKSGDKNKTDLVNKFLERKNLKQRPQAQNTQPKSKTTKANLGSTKRYIEERKEPESEYDSDFSSIPESEFSDSYDSDFDSDSDYSSGYDSDDSAYRGNRNICRCCCDGIFRIFGVVFVKFKRNYIVAGKYCLRALAFLRSERVADFLAKVLKFISIIFLFLLSLSRDIRAYISSFLSFFSKQALVVGKFLSQHFLLLLKYGIQESDRLGRLGWRYGYAGSRDLFTYSKKTLYSATYAVLMSPYWLGKGIVNAPWILYDVFFENTEKLAPVIYGVIGWSIVCFIYVPILATILHSMDIITIEDLDTLHLKNVCLYLGLIREERGFWHVVKKVGNAVFFR